MLWLHIYYNGITVNRIEIINFSILLGASVMFFINRYWSDIISLILFSIISIMYVYLITNFLFECTSYNDMLNNTFFNCLTHIFSSGLGTILLLVSSTTPVYLTCEIYKKSIIAKRGNRKKFLEFMEKVPDVEPDEHDRLN
jgi:hypothetical protein